ncbi:spondin-1-like isoform X2 [Artemia franciscana]|uniref:spondin-1-like isoform X2 n=1 Tax=Artemia franciscana TaxID=6661 RepID=UPI0032DB330E
MEKRLGFDVIVIIIALALRCIEASRCNREPDGRFGQKVHGDNGFRIKVSGSPDKYVPGEVYTVTLQGWRSPNSVQRFVGFMLQVEPEDQNFDTTPETAGTFQLFGDALTRFSDYCPNSVMHTSSIPKSEIQVLWTSPGPGSGCIKFRAMVIESRDVWYADDGGLTKELCEEKQESHDEQPEIVEPCCACDEAKYEVTFEGHWSRQTHPKDYPNNEWLTHFSDIIGASHSTDFRVWEYGGIASDGLRQVAEWGSTRQLEGELKSQSDHIRTIIKSRGLWYPNVNGKTSAVFRVDRKHHLMSLVSMLGPSPDWIVGASALELCLRNCSWVDSRTLNLYPWDAGTDSGITYMSANAPSHPREKIRRISSSWPADPRSPFYDPSNTPMKPVAKLVISRQRVYDKSCSDPVSSFDDESELTHSDNSEDASRPECAVSEWGQWSQCSVTCGKGLRMRQRFYINQMKADMMGCDRQLVEKEMCAAAIETCDGEDTFKHDDVCAVSDWSPWSSCSVTCGKGFRSRTRRYFNRMGRKKCHVELMEKEICAAELMICDEEDQAIPIDPRCAVTAWSDWSPCSVTCGKGMKVRTRLPLYTSQLPNHCQVEMMEKAVCDGDRLECSLDAADAKAVCMQKKDVGPCRGYFPRWYYDVDKGTCTQFIYNGCRGNRNNFERYEDCVKTCEVLFKGNSNIEETDHNTQRDQNEDFHGNYYSRGYDLKHGPFDLRYDRTEYKKSRFRKPEPIDCVVSEWSNWGHCSATCGKGWNEKFRMIKVPSQNGGKPCPRKLVKKRRCILRECPALSRHDDE